MQTGFSTVVDSVISYIRTIKYRSALEDEYIRVREDNERLAYQAMLADELEKKLSAYENLFDEISVNESMNPLPATVIGRDSENYFSVFTINKGSNDGIKDFMAVTMNGALVGYTYDVSPVSSSVRAIIDSEASIAGLISSSRDQGTIRGTLGIDGTPMCRMYYLPAEHLPRPGDIVVTSGVGMSFPKGIPIGTVRESTRGMESNKQFVVIEPHADFEHVEYVVVLRYQPTALGVEQRGNTTDLPLTPLVSDKPIPTVQIGSETFYLSPTPTPGPSTTPLAPDASVDPTLVITPPPPIVEEGYSYVSPLNTPDILYGFTLAPTPSPTPTPPPLDLSVEEDVD